MRISDWSSDVCSSDLTIERQQPLDFAAKADAVIIGSGVKTREIAADPLMLGRIRLDPARQLIGAQCSGTLLLAKLGRSEERREGKSVSVRVDLVGRRIIKKKKHNKI